MEKLRAYASRVVIATKLENVSHSAIIKINQFKSNKIAFVLLLRFPLRDNHNKIRIYVDTQTNVWRWFKKEMGKSIRNWVISIRREPEFANLFVFPRIANDRRHVKLVHAFKEVQLRLLLRYVLRMNIANSDRASVY